MAANSHDAIAIAILILQQAPGLRVHTNFKQSLKEDRDFYRAKCFLKVIKTHKYFAVLLQLPVDHLQCSEYCICT